MRFYAIIAFFSQKWLGKFKNKSWEQAYCIPTSVHLGFSTLLHLARMLDASLAPGPETIEARLFSEDEVPWEQLAFRTVRQTLEHFFADRASGSFGLHTGVIA